MESSNRSKKVFIGLKTSILTTGFLFVVLISLIAFSSRFNLPGGYRAYSVLTGSMEPVIQTGSLILTRAPRSTNEIKMNNVITFEEPSYQNKFITHRVNKIVESNPGVVFQTKGDANSNLDPWLITYGRIKGVYLMHFPYLGSLLEFIRSPLGIVIFVLIPVLLIVADESKNIISALADVKIEKEKKKKDKEGKIHYHFFIWIIAIPVICLGVGQTRALFFSNTVFLNQNSISTAAASPSPSASPGPSESPVGSPSPSASPSPSPSAEVSPLPSPSASPTGGGTVIDISGNGDGSTNNADVENNNNCQTNQNTDTNIDLGIELGSDTGDNEASGNTGGNSTTNSGDAYSGVDVNIQGGSNSSNGCP